MQMNADLLTDDLKKKEVVERKFLAHRPARRGSREDCQGRRHGQLPRDVHGFDYYNPATGTVDSGDTEKIAMWLLRHRLRRSQPVSPAGVLRARPGSDQLKRLAKTLKAEIDEELIESYYGTESLPFEAGEFKRVAVKIVDDRGIESLKDCEFGVVRQSNSLCPNVLTRSTS